MKDVSLTLKYDADDRMPVPVMEYPLYRKIRSHLPNDPLPRHLEECCNPFLDTDGKILCSLMGQIECERMVRKLNERGGDEEVGDPHL